MPREPSQKALLQWGKAKQNEAITAVLRRNEQEKISAPRSAKSKALSQKVWIGAAPAGPGGSKKRLATDTDPGTQKKVKTGKENTAPGKKRIADVQEEDERDEESDHGRYKRQRTSVKVTARNIVHSDPEEESTMGRRHAKLTNDEEDSASNSDSGGEEGLPKPKGQARAEPKAKHPRPDIGSDSDENGEGVDNTTLKKTKRQINREKEIPRWVLLVISDAGVPAERTRKASTVSAPVSLTDSATSEFENKMGQWMPYTYLVYVSGKPLQLLAQKPPIQAVIRKTMEIINSDIVFGNGFPSNAQRVVISRDAALRAAIELDETEIKTRMECEPMYLKEIAKPANSRVSQFCFDLKQAALLIIEEHFNLKKGDDIVEVVQKLYCKKNFIFPGDIRNALPKRDRPYEHPVFPVVLAKLFFKKSTDLGRQHKDRFYSSIDGDDEAEMNAPMLALTVEHTILEFQTGSYIAKPLSGNVCAEMYLSHLGILQDLFEKKIKRYHRLMVGLLYKARTYQNANGDELDEIDYDAMSD